MSISASHCVKGFRNELSSFDLKELIVYREKGLQLDYMVWYAQQVMEIVYQTVED